MLKSLPILITFILLSFYNNAQGSREKDLAQVAEKIRIDPTGNEYLKTLKPSMDDFQKIFVSAGAVGDVWMYTEEMYAGMGEGAVNPGSHRTETIIINVSGANLRAGAEHGLPGGYNSIKDHFKPGVMIYGIKFLEPGKEAGYSLNAFFYVNNHWVCIPKAWRAFE